MNLDLSRYIWQISAIACSFVFCTSISLQVGANEEETLLLHVKQAWAEYGHNLTQHYADQHVEFHTDLPDSFYFVPSPSFDHYSNKLKEAKSLHNSTNVDEYPKIYVIITTRCYGHENQVHTNVSTGTLNIIYCERIQFFDEKPDGYPDFKCFWNSLLEAKHSKGHFSLRSEDLIENLIFFVVNHIICKEDEFPNSLLSHWMIANLLHYYTVHELKHNVVFNKNDENAGGYPQKNIRLFGRWHQRIYDEYGGGKVVRNFLQFIKNLSQEDQDVRIWRNRTISPGEYVHFWSIAADQDLRYVAYLAFGWTKEYQEQFRVAGQEFPSIKYTESFTNYTLLSPIMRCYKRHSKKECQDLIQMEKEVAFVIYPPQINRTFSFLKPFAQAWSYASKTYGPLGPDPYLYLKLYFQERSWRRNDYSLNKGLSSYLILDYYKFTPSFLTTDYPRSSNHFNEVTFLVVNHTQDKIQALQQIENLPVMFKIISTNVIATSKETGNWPAQSISEDAAVDIVTYDINTVLGQTNEENRYFDKRKDVPRLNTFWMRDWYIPLYTHFNGSRALTAFIDQLSAHWPKYGTDYMHQLNVGEFVHFSSAAVNKDLRDLAEKTFGWNETYGQQFDQARSKFTDYNYTDDYTNAMPWRWMALESLLEMKFSASSDVWAFGVTLFEIFSLGSIPYPGGNWTHEFVDQLSSGYRLSAPKYGNEDIHDLMLNCMKKEATERLNFAAITFKLQNLKMKLFPESSGARTNCNYIDISIENV